MRNFKQINDLISLVVDAIKTSTEEEALEYIDTHFDSVPKEIVDHSICILLTNKKQYETEHKERTGIPIRKFPC